MNVQYCERYDRSMNVQTTFSACTNASERLIKVGSQTNAGVLKQAKVVRVYPGYPIRHIL